MIKDRIISTLKFFDLQDLPLTLFELHKFLIGNKAVSLSEVLADVEILNGQGKIDQYRGYYIVPGRQELIEHRLSNYEFGIVREKLIKKYTPILGHIPFVRSVSLAGSQALGQEKPTSDIDLFIITHPSRMWTARTLVTAYFHILKLRRHGNLITNRFCLNHYVAGEKLLSEGRSLYTAMEYAKLRPLVYFSEASKFAKKNLSWIQEFFPNVQLPVENVTDKPSLIQKFLEKLFTGAFGDWLENKLKEIQKKRIHIDQYVRVLEDELSFHPDSQEEKLLAEFGKFE